MKTLYDFTRILSKDTRDGVMRIAISKLPTRDLYDFIGKSLESEAFPLALPLLFERHGKDACDRQSLFMTFFLSRSKNKPLMIPDGFCELLEACLKDPQGSLTHKALCCEMLRRLRNEIQDDFAVLALHQRLQDLDSDELGDPYLWWAENFLAPMTRIHGARFTTDLADKLSATMRTKNNNLMYVAWQASRALMKDIAPFCSQAEVKKIKDFFYQGKSTFEQIPSIMMETYTKSFAAFFRFLEEPDQRAIIHSLIRIFKNFNGWFSFKRITRGDRRTAFQWLSKLAAYCNETERDEILEECVNLSTQFDERSQIIHLNQSLIPHLALFAPGCNENQINLMIQWVKNMTDDVNSGIAEQESLHEHLHEHFLVLIRAIASQCTPLLIRSLVMFMRETESRLWFNTLVLKELAAYVIEPQRTELWDYFKAKFVPFSNLYGSYETKIHDIFDALSHLLRTQEEADWLLGRIIQYNYSYRVTSSFSDPFISRFIHRCSEQKIAEAIDHLYRVYIMHNNCDLTYLSRKILGLAPFCARDKVPKVHELLVSLLDTDNAGRPRVYAFQAIQTILPKCTVTQAKNFVEPLRICLSITFAFNNPYKFHSLLMQTLAACYEQMPKEFVDPQLFSSLLTRLTGQETVPRFQAADCFARLYHNLTDDQVKQIMSCPIFEDRIEIHTLQSIIRTRQSIKALPTKLAL